LPVRLREAMADVALASRERGRPMVTAVTSAAQAQEGHGNIIRRRRRKIFGKTRVGQEDFLYLASE
jgi:hypothetical protein